MRINLRSAILVLGFGIFSTQGRTQDLSIDVHGAMALVSYSKLNVSGGIGSAFGAHPALFFHKSLGIFSGLDHISRPMELNTASSTRWLEIPLGLMFRSGPGDTQLVGLGLSLALPLSNFEDAARSYETNGGLSLVFLTNRYYALNESLSLGIYSDIRYSFHSPFKDADLSQGRIFSFDIGLGARLLL
jgi:hypothetical protein